MGGIFGIIYPIETSKSQCKERLLDPFHRDCTLAKGYKNPFADSDMKYMSSLIKASSRLAKRSNIFKKQYYVPFIKAWRQWLLSLDQPAYKRYFTKDGNLFYQATRGKGIVRVK